MNFASYLFGKKGGVVSVRSSLARFSPLLLLFAVACSKYDRLAELEHRYPVLQEPAYVEVNFCAEKAGIIRTKTKYIFIIDKSGSNEQNYRIDEDGKIVEPIEILPELATDRDGKRRYQQLIEFLSNSPANDPDRYYSLINFSTTARTVRGFTSNRDLFRTTVQNELTNLLDEGATDYLAAIGQAYQLINADILAAKTAAIADPDNKVSSTYLIVFVSDGFPVLSIDTTRTPLVLNAQQPSSIIQKVRDVLALQTDNSDFVDSINLFTGYYFVTGNEDTAARQLLADMARAGHGLAYTFGGTELIDFSYFQVPEKLLKYTLSEIIVTNRSVLWWNGRQVTDSDRDGLPDEVETELGSDPLKSDSDANGVSDYVEYRTSPQSKPCASIQGGRCQTAGARSFVTLIPSLGGCSSIIGWTRVGGAVVFRDSDIDGLNDCEEMVLGNTAGINEFDANGDLIPDALAFRNELEFKAGTHTANSDADLDGTTNYDEIKFGMPAQFPNYQLLMAKPVDYDLKIVSSSTNQDCYQLKLLNMPVLGPDNMIRVEMVQTTSEIVNRKLYRVAEKQYSGSSKVLVINDLLQEAVGVWK